MDSDWSRSRGESIHSEADATVEAVRRHHGHGVIAGRAALYDALRSRQDGDAEVGRRCHNQRGIDRMRQRGVGAGDGEG